MPLFRIVPPKSRMFFPHISRIYPAWFGFIGVIFGIISAFFLVQTLQIDHFSVLGAYTGDSYSNMSFGSSESSNRYEQWKERLKTRPDWRDGWIIAGRLALEAGRLDEALIAVNHSLLLDPNHEESRKLLNEILDGRRSENDK